MCIFNGLIRSSRRTSENGPKLLRTGGQEGYRDAFVGRAGGTITLHSLAESSGCRVLVADDGVGLPEGTEWPARGKLGALIVRSLRENAKAGIEVESRLGLGTRVSIVFARAAAAPQEP